MVKIPLPAGSYPTDEHEIINFRHWSGRKINRYGLHFDGVDDYVNCGNIMFGTGDFTAIVFLRFPLLGERFSRIIDKNVNSCNGFSLLKDEDNAYGFQFLMYYDDNGTIYGNPRLAVKNISEGNHLIAGVRSGYYCKAYLDGVLKAQETTQFITDISSSDPITIGGNVKYLNSNIYFVALYNRALSDAEISQMYDYVVNGKGYLILDGLVLLLDFTEHGSNILYDKSGNENHGTIYGATWLDEPSEKVDAFVPVVEG